MIADSVEAVSRSIDNYSEESITELVERIIDTQIQENQFTDAPITFNDITVIKKIFIKRLLNIFHVRIAYPKRQEKRLPEIYHFNTFISCLVEYKECWFIFCFKVIKYYVQGDCYSTFCFVLSNL